MAEPCTKAFGRYLRILRERRDLSLDDVQSLSQAFADPVSKAYLSRCENGYQLPAVSKLIPLSRIYDVPVEVLTERMELDMELDRIGGPETTALDFRQLREHAHRAMDDGRTWYQYAFSRDAILRATFDPPIDGLRDAREQLYVSLMNCAIAATSLGRLRFPLHEFSFLLETKVLTPSFVVILKERLSLCYWGLQQVERSSQMADAAIADATSLGDTRVLGFTLSNRAIIASKSGDHETALRHYQRAFTSYKGVGLQRECARTLNNIAQVYFDLRRYDSARRAIAAARRIALAAGHIRALALGRILLAEIEILEGETTKAHAHLSEAVSIARELKDGVLRFKAEFQLFRLAARVGDVPAKRALQRRLNRLKAWLPQQVPELTEYLKSVG